MFSPRFALPRSSSRPPPPPPSAVAATLIGDLARVDTHSFSPPRRSDGSSPPSLPPSLRQAETAHIASASVSWRDKIKFLDGGLVLRAAERNALGREGVREHADDINWHNARRPILICSFDVGKKTSAVHGMWTDLKEGISGEGGLYWKAKLH